MRKDPRLVVALVSLMAGLSSCGDDGKVQEPTVPDDGGALAVWLTLQGPSLGTPVAGDTLVSEVRVINNGEGEVWDVVVIDSLIPRFTLLGAGGEPGTRVTLGEAVRMDSLSLAPGDTAALTVRLRVPALFPDGFARSARARVTYDHDSSAATPKRLVLSDDPGTPAEGDRTTVTLGNEGMDFLLLAPGVPEVYLSGEFNGWQPQWPDYLMFPGEDGQWWGLTVPILKGRQEYKFVLVDAAGDRHSIGDPRATRLAPDGFGRYNSVAGVPLPGPVGRLPGGIDPTRLVIYELFTWDFSAAGDLAGLLEGLTGGDQNLADLGVNAVELLPMTTAYSPGFNWGYAPGFYFAVDPDYGTPEEMAEFVETAHANGIAMILDMVFNHCDGGSPLAVLDQVGTPGVFINRSQGHVFGMPQLNWRPGEMREFLLECALFWIEQYGIDGFRMDLVDSRDYTGYLWWRNQVKSLHPEVFLIGEDFGYPWEGNSVTVAGLDAQWGGQHTDLWGGNANNFQQIVMALLEEDPYQPRGGGQLGCFEAGCNPMWALANVLEPTPGYPTHHNEVKYIVSHDERRLVYEVEQGGSPEAAVIGGIAKAKLGAATLLTAVGIPMIYMGEEIGEDDYVPEDPEPNKVDWGEGDAGLRAYYREMIELRLSHPTLSGGGIDFHCPSWGVVSPFGTCQAQKTICYWRYPGSGPSSADIVVASNFDHADHDFDIPFPSSGTWHRFDPESGTATPVAVVGGTLSRTLTASTAYIFLREESLK